MLFDERVVLVVSHRSQIVWYSQPRRLGPFGTLLLILVVFLLSLLFVVVVFAASHSRCIAQFLVPRTEEILHAWKVLWYMSPCVDLLLRQPAAATAIGHYAFMSFFQSQLHDAPSTSSWSLVFLTHRAYSAVLSSAHKIY